MRLAIVSVSLLATVLACSKTGGAASEVKDTFNHSCRSDDDCAVAFFGPTCGICSSSNGAIAKSDQAAYQKAYNTARGNCPKDGAVGKCAQHYYVSQCSSAKTCTFQDCDYDRPVDEHHCAAATDGGR